MFASFSLLIPMSIFSFQLAKLFKERFKKMLFQNSLVILNQFFEATKPIITISCHQRNNIKNAIL